MGKQYWRQKLRLALRDNKTRPGKDSEKQRKKVVSSQTFSVRGTESLIPTAQPHKRRNVNLC